MSRGLTEGLVAANRYRDKVLMMDRTGWQRNQYIDEAREIMAHEDGSTQALLREHIEALLAEVDDLRKWVIDGD